MVFAWTIIRKTFVISKFVSRNGRERTGFGNVIADKSIKILVRPTLPARVGINKVSDGSESFIGIAEALQYHRAAPGVLQWQVP